MFHPRPPQQGLLPAQPAARHRVNSVFHPRPPQQGLLLAQPAARHMPCRSSSESEVGSASCARVRMPRSTDEAQAAASNCIASATRSVLGAASGAPQSGSRVPPKASATRSSYATPKIKLAKIAVAKHPCLKKRRRPKTKQQEKLVPVSVLQSMCSIVYLGLVQT